MEQRWIFMAFKELKKNKKRKVMIEENRHPMIEWKVLKYYSMIFKVIFIIKKNVLLTRMTIVTGCNKSSSGMARLTVTLPETLSNSK